MNGRSSSESKTMLSSMTELVQPLPSDHAEDRLAVDCEARGVFDPTVIVGL